MKKNRLFYRIYSDSERILEGCTEFPASISRQDAQMLAEGIDKATDALCGKKAAEMPEVPETDEPSLKAGDDQRPFNFHVLTSDRKGKQSIEFFEAHVGDFFLIKKSPWNNGVSFRKATIEDYAALGELAPAKEMLDAAYWKGRKDGNQVITPRNHPKDENGHNKDTKYTEVLWEMEQAHSVNYDCKSSLIAYLRRLAATANAAAKHYENIEQRDNALFQARFEVLQCKEDCIAHTLSKSKKNAMCRYCQRKADTRDNYEPQH